MADALTITAPDLTAYVDQRFFIEPLGGPQHPQNYLDRFPDEVYNKSPDSRLTKLMYVLLGPAGGGWIRKNYLQARLLLEDHGLQLGSLEDFYGDPLSFGRILDEVYDEDPGGLIPRDKWQEIQARDARYRNRAIDYLHGARMGTTLAGLTLVAKAGLGHDVEIIENYRYFYDQWSDDPLGLPRFGQTTSLQEFVILPRQLLPQQAVQTLTIKGAPTGGTFVIGYGGQQTVALAYNAANDTVQQALWNLSNINNGDVVVEGGPLPNTPIRIRFTGKLQYAKVPQLWTTNALTGGTNPFIVVEMTQEGYDAVDEIAYIAPTDQHGLQVAIDHIRPVASIVSVAPARGITSRTLWQNVFAGSEYAEVVRYVTGNNGVPWPARDTTHWIEASVEHEGPRLLDDLKHHYQGFHNIASASAYTEAALADPGYGADLAALTAYKSTHIGPYSAYQRALYPVLDDNPSFDFEHASVRALADYAEPLQVSSVADTTGGPAPFINGIYPVDYQGLPNVPQIVADATKYWGSLERGAGTEYLEIDLGRVQAVNFIAFEATKKPFDFDVTFDLLDQAPARDFVPVRLDPSQPSITGVGYGLTAQNPWQYCELHFGNRYGRTIFTRFLRLGFTRRVDPTSPFLQPDGTVIPFSIEIRNLRVGRNVV
jgi:hypothetical protein